MGSDSFVKDDINTFNDYRYKCFLIPMWLGLIGEIQIDGENIKQSSINALLD